MATTTSTLPPPQLQLEDTKLYFYSEDDPELYDLVADLHTPHYTQMHEAVVESLRSLMGRASRFDVAGLNGPTFLDLGSGTGMEAIGIMKAIPNSRFVCLDHSRRMNEAFQRKLIGMGDWRERCTIRNVDIASPEFRCRDHCLETGIGAGFDAVVSALVLHHFSPEHKRRLYRDIFETLKPGGVFVNADLFTYQDPSLARRAQEHLSNWISACFNDPPSNVVNAVSRLGRTLEGLGPKWLDHVNTENVPLPFQDSQGNGEIDILREVGFSEIESPLRIWQVGTLWARKKPA